MLRLTYFHATQCQFFDQCSHVMVIIQLCQMLVIYLITKFKSQAHLGGIIITYGNQVFSVFQLIGDMKGASLYHTYRSKRTST